MEIKHHTNALGEEVAKDLSSLSNEELTQSVQSLSRPVWSHVGSRPEQLEDIVHELHVHRVELEMQSRALREAEAEIEAALQRYSDLYDHPPIGYVTLTPKGRIAQVNLTATGWLHRDRAELVGSHLSSYMDAFDAGRFAAHLEACVSTGTEQMAETTLRLENGLLLTVQLTSRLAPKIRDAETYILTAITNISKVKQARASVQDISLERDSTAQSDSESLRAPLVTVTNFARTLLHHHAAELGVEVKSVIERMECAAVRMDATVQHLLEYCCLEHAELALDPVSLEELMQHVMMEHRGFIQRQRAQITIERPLPCVRGARLVLGQVLANLLTNALRHVPPEKTPRLRISATAQGQETILTIATVASGEATEMAWQPEVFHRTKEKEREQAAEVALVVVRQAVERMNGRVWTDVAAGKVTCFHIGLPTV
jgi:PAS domain S-box-containing protein